MRWCTPIKKGIFEIYQGGGIVYTLAELVTFAAVMCYLFLYKYNVLSLLLAMIAFSWLFLSFVQKRGYLARLLDRDWCVVLGRYAFAIYVVHIFVLDSARIIILPQYKSWAVEHPWLVLGGMAAATMFLAILGYHGVEKPVMRWYKNSKKSTPQTIQESATPQCPIT